MLTLLLIVVLIVLSIFIYITLIRKNNNFNSLDFPEPPSNFLFGHVFEFKSTVETLAVCQRLLKEYGATVKLNMANIYFSLLTIDYKLIETILTSNKNLGKSQNYDFLKPWLGSGLLINNGGSQWKQHRKILTPAFHFQILKQFVLTFQSVSDVFIEKLRKFDGVASVDLYPLVTLCTLDIISETAMGTKINAQLGEHSEYVASVKDMSRIIIDRCLSPLKIFNCTFIFTWDYWKQRRHLRVLHNFTSNVIRRRKEDLQKRISTNSECKKMAFLDLLLKYSLEEDLLTDEEIRNEVDTFMFEGHDTTASGICFTLFCLANHPEIQDGVLKEQIDLFGEVKNPEITLKHLQEMKYLEMVIKETLRLYPPVPIIGRYVTEDIEFEGNIIPKHLNIVILLYGLHRDPILFPEPNKFKPERFASINSSLLPYAFIPFSAGARNCIGQKFAMLEMKSIVSKVVRNFQLLPANPKHELILAAETVFKSINGVKIGIKVRS